MLLPQIIDSIVLAVINDEFEGTEDDENLIFDGSLSKCPYFEFKDGKVVRRETAIKRHSGVRK